MTGKDADAFIRDAHNQALILLKRGTSEHDAVNALVQSGLDAGYAETVVDNMQREISDRKGFLKLLVGGIFTVCCGLGINYFSRQIAINTGLLFFFVFWGIVVGGILMILRAFLYFRK